MAQLDPIPSASASVVPELALPANDIEHATTARVVPADDALLDQALAELIEQRQIDTVIETGTGAKATLALRIARHLKRITEPQAEHAPLMLTIESNWMHWRSARQRLAEYPFVECSWGSSISLREARRFLAQTTAGPLTQQYERELDRTHGPRARNLTDRFRQAFDRRFSYQGQRLLRRALGDYRGDRPLVVLDAAEGTGLLEFQTVRRQLSAHRFGLLLCDTDRTKHRQSRMAVVSNPGFEVLAEGLDQTWLLAWYTPTNRLAVARQVTSRPRPA